MINQKYYSDIKAFPSQFEVGVQLASGIKVQGHFEKVFLCGMGGSSLVTEMINDFLVSVGEKVQPIIPVRGYELPLYADKKSLVFAISHSGNTEETLSCIDQILAQKFACVVLASGGKLAEIAEQNRLPLFRIPKGLQPRLSSGYMMVAILKVMANAGYIRDYSEDLMAAAGSLGRLVDEKGARDLARKLANKVPIVYATDNAGGIARVSKIKFNENSKIQCFWNVIPELHHNEMVGWTKVLMQPYFIILKSKFAHARNKRRIEVLMELMKGKGLAGEVMEMKGESLLKEMLSTYMFIDYVTYYLADAYGIDPEPVAMVEDFKKKLG